MLCKWIAAALVATAVGTNSLSSAGDATAGSSPPPDEAPVHGLWVGGHVGAFVPFGGLYADRDLVTTTFQDVATGGPLGEVDLGYRFARRFIVYGFFEYAALGRGGSLAWAMDHGGQANGSTTSMGAGLRWTSHPDRIGLIVDVGFGDRWFVARWADGTTMRMQGFSDVRLGGGANFRLAQDAEIALMLTLHSGVFGARTFEDQSLGLTASAYEAAVLSVGGHFDVLRSR